MTTCHLHLAACETEFSSWSASLTFILAKTPNVSSGGIRNTERSANNLYVSVIDTEMLWDTTPAFYVPLLDFLNSGNRYFPHEYLVHGVIKGSWYKAVKYRDLEVAATGRWNIPICPFYTCLDLNMQPITEEWIKDMKEIAKHFGRKFELPMTIALLCCEKCDDDCWLCGIKKVVLDVILDGIHELTIPTSCKKPHTHAHTISKGNFQDTIQMTRLLRVVWRQVKHGRILHDASQSRSQRSTVQQLRLQQRQPRYVDPDSWLDLGW